MRAASPDRGSQGGLKRSSQRDPFSADRSNRSRTLRRFPIKGLRGRELREPLLRQSRRKLWHAEVGAFGKVLPQQPVVFSFVPRCHGLCGSQKVDLHARVESSGVRAEPFQLLAPSQRPTQVLRQRDDRARDGVAHPISTMSSEGRSVLHAERRPWPGNARQGSNRVNRVVPLHTNVARSPNCQDPG